MSTDQTAPVVLSVQQYRGNNDDISEHESKAMAGNMLRTKFRQQGMRMDSDPVASAPMSARLINDGADWVPWEGPGKPDGQVITWTATGVESIADPEPLSNGHVGPDGAYVIALPGEVTAGGGLVRVMHNLDRPVTVYAFGNTGPIGYEFTQPITSNEEQVQLVPGTVMLRIQPDA